MRDVLKMYEAAIAAARAMAKSGVERSSVSLGASLTRDEVDRLAELFVAEVRVHEHTTPDFPGLPGVSRIRIFAFTAHATSERAEINGQGSEVLETIAPLSAVAS